MSEEIALIQSLLGRNGGVATIGFINNSQSDSLLINASLKCLVRPDEFKPNMLFATSLDVFGNNRTIRPGPNCFDIAVQGYNLIEPMTPLARRNFEYIFRMIRTRASAIVRMSSDEAAKKSFCDAAIGFAEAIIDLPYNDTADYSASLARFDTQLAHMVSVRWLQGNGDVAGGDIPLNSNLVAQWLANHIVGTEKALL